MYGSIQSRINWLSGTMVDYMWESYMKKILRSVGLPCYYKTFDKYQDVYFAIENGVWIQVNFWVSEKFNVQRLTCLLQRTERYLAAGVWRPRHCPDVVLMMCHTLATVRADLHVIVILRNIFIERRNSVRIVTMTMTTIIGGPVTTFDPGWVRYAGG